MIPPADIKPINRDELKNCRFIAARRQPSERETRERNRKVHLSLLLSENSEGRVKIVFNTINGYAEIQTSIWGATDKFIFVKGGNTIPVEAVAHVILQ
jgi:hypothetical protein